MCERGRLSRVREVRRSLGWLPKASQVTKEFGRNCPFPKGLTRNARSTLSAGSGVGPTTPFASPPSHRIGVKRITRFVNGQALSAVRARVARGVLTCRWRAPPKRWTATRCRAVPTGPSAGSGRPSGASDGSRPASARARRARPRARARARCRSDRAHVWRPTARQADEERSFGPKNTASIPGTDRISSSFSIAVRVFRVITMTAVPVLESAT